MQLPLQLSPSLPANGPDVDANALFNWLKQFPGHYVHLSGRPHLPKIYPSYAHAFLTPTGLYAYPVDQLTHPTDLGTTFLAAARYATILKAKVEPHFAHEIPYAELQRRTRNPLTLQYNLLQEGYQLIVSTGKEIHPDEPVQAVFLTETAYEYCAHFKIQRHIVEPTPPEVIPEL